jgi:hypothetical protein
MMAVDNLGLKPGDHVQEPVRKNPFIRFHFRGRQITETPAGIGHDVAHPHHREGEITALKAHKFTGRGPQHAQLRFFSLGHPGQEKVFMPPAGGFPDHGLNIDAAPRGLRPLTEQMQNLHTCVRDLRNDSLPVSAPPGPELPYLGHGLPPAPMITILR